MPNFEFLLFLFPEIRRHKVAIFTTERFIAIRHLPPGNLIILSLWVARVLCILLYKGGFPVMTEITRITAANICRQVFFVITTTTSTRCLVQNFEPICYSQLVNATSQCNHSRGSKCSKWPNDRMVAVVKHCWLLVEEEEAAEKDD